MKKDCLMQYKDITRVEVIDPIGGRAYVNSNANMPTISFQDDGKTLKVFVQTLSELHRNQETTDNDILDPMNMLIVNGVPYSFEDVEEIISGFYDGHHREYFTSDMDMHLDCFTDIVNNLKKKSKDTSLEAWQKEVVAGNTTSGYIEWKNEA